MQSHPRRTSRPSELAIGICSRPRAGDGVWAGAVVMALVLLLFAGSAAGAPRDAGASSVTAPAPRAKQPSLIDAPRPTEKAAGSFTHLAGLPLTDAKDKLVAEFERFAIQSALEQHAGNISAAARQLGIHRQSLQQKMDQLGIHRC